MSAALVAAVFIDFLRTNVQVHVWDPILHRAAVAYEELFSWGTRHHCPMEVGAYVQHKSQNEHAPF